MSKRIRFEITASGEIRAKTLGMKGEECLDYVELMEQLLDARAVDSQFTEEYNETKIKHRVHLHQDLKEE